jgi:hypothetical protein
MTILTHRPRILTGLKKIFFNGKTKMIFGRKKKECEKGYDDDIIPFDVTVFVRAESFKIL